MYLGRDNDYNETDSFEEIYINFRKSLDSNEWSSKEIEVDQMVQKVPLDQYLLQGFKILDIKI